MNGSMPCQMHEKGVQILEVPVGGRNWIIERGDDCDTLWEQMGDNDFGDDERIPYWAEIWPASILLGRHILRNRELIAGRRCLDIGCGLGLTAVIGAFAGAHVVAFDYEFDALKYARRNIIHNDVPPVLFTCMDWRQPALPEHSFDMMWAGDVFYERRFFTPLEQLMRRHLAPGGEILIGEPRRTISSGVWDELRELGWQVDTVVTEVVRFDGQRPEVNLRRMTLPVCD